MEALLFYIFLIFTPNKLTTKKMAVFESKYFEQQRKKYETNSVC